MPDWTEELPVYFLIKSLVDLRDTVWCRPGTPDYGIVIDSLNC